MNLFENIGLSPQQMNVITKLGFSKPTEIQEKSIPEIIKGKDVIGESATGSGKTLAFGCAMEHLVPKKGLQALILTPTRELAEQVKDELIKLSQHKHLKVITIYGGVAINPQIDGLLRADVVVATPGRLLDHLERRTIDTSRIKLLVMDEADRMFDMGFIDDVEKIISQCPKKRQTLFFSATISTRVKNLGQRHMVNPVLVKAKNMVDPSKLKQVYYNVDKNMKLSLLVHLLQNEESGLVMVFCNMRRITDFVVKNLKANKIDATAIHGGLSQNKRTNTIKSFNSGKVCVLVCTDVAARGLHIDDVSHIYNYDLPKDPKDYVHRIGRTARAGEEGKVINLLCDMDYDNFSRILETYREFTIEKMERIQVKKVFARMDRPAHRHGIGPRGQYRSGGQRGGRGPRRGPGGYGQRSHSGPRTHSGPRRYNGPRNDSQNRGPRSNSGPRNNSGQSGGSGPRNNSQNRGRFSQRR